MAFETQLLAQGRVVLVLRGGAAPEAALAAMRGAAHQHFPNRELHMTSVPSSTLALHGGKPSVIEPPDSCWHGPAEVGTKGVE